MKAAERTTLSCPMCDSHDRGDYVVIGYGSQREGGVRDYGVLRCRKHRVEFADAKPVPSDPGDQKQAIDGCGYGNPEESSPRYADFMDRVEKVAGKRDGGVVHDVGCGNGQLLFEARRRGWTVQGSDIVPGVKPFLEASGIRCFVGNLSEMGIEAGSCDVVTSFCVLPHHLTNPTPEMLAVHRMLKVDGWFVLQMPNDGLFRKTARLTACMLWPWGPSKFSRFLLAQVFGPGGHQFGYTKRNITEYLRHCGFGEVVVEAYYPSTSYALARFQERPLWYRIPIAGAVNAIQLTGKVLGLPNHIFVYARKQCPT